MYQNKLITANHRQGITLLEILIAFAVMLFLAAIVIGSFAQFRNSKVLDTATEEIVSVLAKARGKTLASVNATTYGVHFETAQVVLFSGAAYNASALDNEVYVLDPALEISSIALSGGGADVIFARLTGKADRNGTITVRVKSDISKSRTITLHGTGIAGVN